MRIKVENEVTVHAELFMRQCIFIRRRLGFQLILKLLPKNEFGSGLDKIFIEKNFISFFFPAKSGFYLSTFFQ